MTSSKRPLLASDKMKTKSTTPNYNEAVSWQLEAEVTSYSAVEIM